MKRSITFAMFLTLLVGITPPNLMGHASSADKFKSGIAGRTTDPNGSVVVGVRIKITAASTKAVVSLKSNDQGEYVADLDPGVYDVEADADGFKKATRKSISVLRESRSFVDFVLEPKPPFDHHIVH